MLTVLSRAGRQLRFRDQFVGRGEDRFHRGKESMADQASDFLSQGEVGQREVTGGPCGIGLIFPKSLRYRSLISS